MIELDHVHLWRRTQEEYAYDLKRTIFAVIERRYRPPKRRHVLRDVTFRIGAGEKVGIIGPNGSGKTTVLKVIAGILRPTAGSVRVTGSIAPLIELGAGFDLDLSVVDNIVYYGVMLGRNARAARASVDGILDFAGLFDHANEPLKTLSSGMVARLGFAIATDTRPDILILDEVLAVGDESFRRRSYNRLLGLVDEKTTVLVVSHDANFIRSLTDRAILIEKGAIVADGASSDVSALYESRLASSAAEALVATHLDARTIATLENRCFRGNGTTFDEQKIFLIQGGRKHWIMDGAYLARHGIDWPHDVTFVEGGVLEEVPEGEPIL